MSGKLVGKERLVSEWRLGGGVDGKCDVRRRVKLKVLLFLLHGGMSRRVCILYPQEAYHTLVCRYQLAIGGVKIELRREVEVKAFSFGPGLSASGEALVEGYGNSPRAIWRRNRVASS
ncbi:hypothetical protein R3P38DRAFT_3353399 [Favolaschia claudopus]|uniref:Uncharacterized protein n=1 Tax=Favolaschia claudopus TaxID=2862362 RepID=A0AAW0BUZ3_9AGAR